MMLTYDTEVKTMIGVLANTLAVIIGGSLGLLLKKGIPERVSGAVMTALGLCTVYIGIDGALDGSNTIVLIVSMVLGTICGTLLNIDGAVSRLGEFFERRVNSTDGKIPIAQGFMTASMLFCVGAMTIVGSINAGLMDDNKLLFTKSILDLISSCMLASTLGVGVLFSAATVFFYQGTLVLLAELLQRVLTDTALIAEITCAGSLMIIGLGLNIIGITKIKVADQLPAILFVPIVYYLAQNLPI